MINFKENNKMKRVILLLFLTALCSGVVWAQSRTVTGLVVSDDDPAGMPGVSVTILGTTIGAVTDINGRYRISVPSDEAVLRFTFVSFAPVEIMVGNQTVINVTMKEDVMALEEMVIVGYGEQTKASIVGAVSNIRTEDLKRAAPTNLTAAIGGRVTGAMVRLGDGNLGGGDYGNATNLNTNDNYSGVIDNSSIFIRGRATSGNAAPLVLVDGVESSFSRVNPEDVEGFSVLKDASATAIFGVRGANGVILITTKKGVVGKPKISMNAQFRSHSTLKFPRPLRAYDYAFLKNEADRNIGANPTYSQEDLDHWKYGTDPFGHPDTDWYEEMVRNFFPEEQINMNISGGTENVKYYVSGEYNHAGGPWKTAPHLATKYKRYNLRTNFDFKLTKTTELSVKLNGRLEHRGDPFFGESTGQRYYGSFWSAILSNGGIEGPVRNPNGTYAYGTGTNWNLKAVAETGGYRQRMSNSLDTRLNLVQHLDFILPGLSLRGMYGTNISAGIRRNYGNEGDTELWTYTPPTYHEDGSEKTPEKYVQRRPPAAQSRGNPEFNFLPYGRNEQLEFSLNYDKLLVENHRVSLVAVFTQSKAESNYSLPSSHRGFAGRLSYHYKSKYLVELSGAYNGSDQFNEDNRYAWFPSASMGWVISEEHFWKQNLLFINFLKIRGSYGLAGNDKLGNYSFMYRAEFVDRPNSAKWTEYRHEDYNFGMTPTQSNNGIVEGKLANENITWEISTKSNVGIDLHFWNSKIKFSADVFREKREGIMAIRGDVPTQSGINTSLLPPENCRIVTNRGYEFELEYSENIGDFYFSVGGNYSFARSKVDFAAEAYRDLKYQMIAGYPVDQPLGYLWTGKFYEAEDLLKDSGVPLYAGAIPGDLIFKDLNEDGVIDELDRTRDRAIGYTPYPEIIYGFNQNFSYKGFYIDLFWQGAANLSSRWTEELSYEFRNANRVLLPIHQDRWAYYQDFDGTWIDTRATAKYPALQPNSGSILTRQVSSFSLKNSNFLRLKTVEIGYQFPKEWVKRINMSAARLFLCGSNLMTFDKVGYLDPEYNPTSSGQRGNSYPQTKFYAVGLNVTF